MRVKNSVVISTLAIFFIFLFISSSIINSTTSTIYIKLAQNLNANNYGFKFLGDLYQNQFILWFPQYNDSAIILVPNTVAPNSTTGALMLVFIEYPNGTKAIIPYQVITQVAGQTKLAFNLNLGPSGVQVNTGYAWSNLQFLNNPSGTTSISLPILSTNPSTLTVKQLAPYLPLANISVPSVSAGSSIPASVYGSTTITNPIGSFNGGSSINIVNSSHGAIAINGGNGIVIQNTANGTVWFSSGNTYESINYNSVTQETTNVNEYSYSYSTYSSYAPTSVYEPTNINETSVQYIIPNSSSSSSTGLSGSMLFWVAIGAGIFIILIIIVVALSGSHKHKQ
ncbi:hypothetical protein [Sulfolobus super-elliptical virus]|nr:hypothetical protein [Sulfolobus super-elliptical virus]